jgi:hypothetical protein
MVAPHDVGAASDNPPAREDAMGACLEKVAAHALTLGASVPTPRIGCGLAGGRWEPIAPRVRGLLCARGVRVPAYDFDAGAGTRP